MRRMHLFFAVGLVWVLAIGAAADPVVSNVTASQRKDGSGLVDVYYTLAGATPDVRVDLAFSNDNGNTWNVIPSPNTLTGDVGNGITNGTGRHIVWDAARDRAEVYWPQTRARVRASALGHSVTFMLPGGVELEMVRIPEGTIVMGSSPDLNPYRAATERPLHTVTIGEDFFLGRYVITFDQWFSVMTDYLTDYFKAQISSDLVYPMSHVCWDHVQEFIRRLNTLGIGTFRLPTEAEWEYACRAGTTTRWSFGNDESLLGAYAWYKDNSTPWDPEPVGQKLPNPFGLYDMHGNVWEWVQDTWHENYTGAPTDGSAWEGSDGYMRVVRGGSTGDSPANCRSAARDYYFSPDSRIMHGFRVVRTR